MHFIDFDNSMFRYLKYVVIKGIIVYGRAPSKIFCLAKLCGVEVIAFESDFGLSHKKEVG